MEGGYRKAVKPKDEASWIKSGSAARASGKTGSQAAGKPKQLLQVQKSSLSQATSVPDLTGKRESDGFLKPSARQDDYGSSEQLNVDRDDQDGENDVRVSFPPPKSTPKGRATTPQFADRSGIPKGRVTPSQGPFDPSRDQPEEEATGWSLGGKERDLVKSKIADVLGRRAGQSQSQTPSPMPVPNLPGPDVAPPPIPPPIVKPKAIKAGGAPKAVEASEEPLIKPSAVKATQPKMEDIVGSASGLASKLPKNINQQALLDQFNAMWDTADVLPEIEIIKCGLPEAKRPQEAENRTDVEDCIRRLMANDPSLTEININNMKRTPVPQVQRLIEALPYSNHIKVLSMANLGLSDAALQPILQALQQNASLEKLNLETNFLSGDFLARMFQALLNNQTLQEIKAVNQSAAISNQAEVNIMKAIYQNRGLWKVSLNFRLPETRQKVDQALIRNGELRRLKRQIEAMAMQAQDG